MNDSPKGMHSHRPKVNKLPNEKQSESTQKCIWGRKYSTSTHSSLVKWALLESSKKSTKTDEYSGQLPRRENEKHTNILMQDELGAG